MSLQQVPWTARVVNRTQETPSVFTLGMELCDPGVAEAYRFSPGQFNMLYLYGVGEVPISVVSDPEHSDEIMHTVRSVGRITKGLEALQPGDQLGLRGPFGRGWPVEQAMGGDVLLVTGGLGCAPVVSVINYIMQRRGQFGRLGIVQGVKHMDDLIWRQRYEDWSAQEGTEVHLAADVAGAGWNWHVGLVTELFDQLTLDLKQALVMLCGPEPMMVAAIRRLLELGAVPEALWLSMERNMQCAVGLCGHCQYGKDFLCRQGPVFNYPDIADRLGVKGF